MATTEEPARAETEPTHDDLDDWGGGPDTEPDYDAEPPHPHDMERASWHRQQAATHTRRMADILAAYDRTLSHLAARRTAAESYHRRRITWHELAVEHWHRSAAARDEVGTTVELPGGRSQLVNQEPEPELADEEAFRAWCASVGIEDQIWVRREPVFRAGEFKKTARTLRPDGNYEPNQTFPAVDPETGEQVPGLRFRARAKRWQKGSQT